MFLFVVGSPTCSSTPGGIEMGMRPSLDCRSLVVENCRCREDDCHAGTRNPGSVTAGDDDAAWPNALLQLGAILVTIANTVMPACASPKVSGELTFIIPQAGTFLLSHLVTWLLPGPLSLPIQVPRSRHRVYLYMISQVIGYYRRWQSTTVPLR